MMSKARHALGYVIEVLSVIAFTICHLGRLLALLVSMRLGPKPGLLGKDVVVVHGFTTANLFHILTRTWLEVHGYRVHMTKFGLQKEDMRETAKKLKLYVGNRELKGATILGFSQGGVIGLYYLEKLGGWSKAERLIAVSSPFKGSQLAKYRGVEACIQMRPGSDFIKELMGDNGNGSDLTNKDLIHSITGVKDEVVAPVYSKIEGVNNYQLDVIGHATIQGFHKGTVELIDKIIKGQI